MNLTQSLEHQATHRLTFEQSQRLMQLVDLRKEICARLDRMAKDFRCMLEELKRVQRQIKGIGGGYRAKVAWTVTPEFRFNWKALACVALVLSVTSAFAQPRPAAAVATNYPPDLYPLTIAWNYTNPVPASTVIQLWTNGGNFLYTTNRPASPGENRVTIALPAAQWKLAAWAIEPGLTIPRTSILTVARSKTMTVTATDLRNGSRIIYTGPTMPGDYAYLQMWITEGWETK